MNKFFLFLLVSFFSLIINAKDICLNTRGLNTEDITIANKKANAILDKLSLINDSIRENVQIIITNRYLELRDIHIKYDERNKIIETKFSQQVEKEEELERSYYQYNSDLYRSRFGYIAWLSFYLNEKQIETVKDVMTLNLLHIRYNDFLDLLPNMTEVDKNRVHHWLVEAREFSMDFETGRKMRQMFTKYRGRINNYLSSRGYDLRKATEAQKMRNIKK